MAPRRVTGTLGDSKGTLHSKLQPLWLEDTRLAHGFTAHLQVREKQKAGEKKRHTGNENQEYGEGKNGREKSGCPRALESCMEHPV